MKNINIATGDIVLDDLPDAITPSMRKTDFLSSRLSNEIIRKDERADWGKFVFRPLQIGGIPFTLSLSFKGEIIETVTLSLWDGKERDWNNWSEEDELEKKNKHDKWLRLQIGNPPYQYQWGIIQSVYVWQEASSKITISFK